MPIARALVAGGVRVLEVTLRTPAALAAIAAIARAVPEAIVGAGTVRSVADARAAHAAGARFAVSPGWSPQRRRGVPRRRPRAPARRRDGERGDGRGRCDGYRFLKFFPAGAAGGTAMLKALGRARSPTSRSVPPAASRRRRRRDYLALANVRVVGGSWLTPADALASGRLAAHRAARSRQPRDALSAALPARAQVRDAVRRRARSARSCSRRDR